MMGKRKNILALLACLLIACVGGVGYSCISDRWQFKPGALIVSGSQMSSLSNAAARLLTVHGFRRVSDSKVVDVSVYHALVLVPRAPIVGGGSSSTSGPVAVETLIWKIEGGPDNSPNSYEKTLELKFHGAEKKITVGTETYDLSAGNLFVIRLNDDWSPTSTQIPFHIQNRAEPEQVLEAFKVSFPKDEIIQSLAFP